MSVSSVNWQEIGKNRLLKFDFDFCSVNSQMKVFYLSLINTYRLSEYQHDQRVALERYHLFVNSLWKFLIKETFLDRTTDRSCDYVWREIICM